MAADDQKGWQWQYAKPGPYATSLSPDDEQGFQNWVSQNKIPWQDSPKADYDMRGYYKAMQSGDPLAAQAQNKHFPDKWKTPYHTSFSGESMYSTPGGPAWKGNQLLDPSGKVLFDENAQPPQKKVIKVGDHVVAFPGHFDDSRINNALKAFRATMPQQPTAQQVHTRATNPHFAPAQTEQSESVRQQGATPQLPAPSWNDLRQYVQQKTAPSVPAPTQGSLNTGQSIADINRLTGDYTTNILKRAGSTLFGMVDFPVQAAGTIRDLFSDDPNVSQQAESNLLSMHPGAMVADRLKEAKQDWQQSKALAGTNLAGDALGFYLGGKLDHGIDAVPLKEAPARTNTLPVISNSIGDVRRGINGETSVWLSPKGWDTWMHNVFPNENPANIPGVSVASNDALKGMFNSKATASPEWLQVQHLIGQAHDLSKQNSISFLQNDPTAHINVLPEEMMHTWQRGLANNGSLSNHLTPEAFQSLAANIPKPMLDMFAREGYASDPKTRVIETAAKYLAGDMNGATPEQANQFLNNYFTEVSKTHGPAAIDRLQKTRAALAQMQEQINGEHQLWNQRANRPGPQPSVPSVAARPTPPVSPQPAATANAIPEPVFQRTANVAGSQDAAFKREHLQREANFNDPNNWIAAGARDFAAREGRTLQPQAYSPVDFRSQEIGDAYDAMKHNPNDPRVKASYDAMKADIDKQWNYATNDMGMKFDPSKENPYANSQEMVNDVKNNHHLAFYQGGDMPADHPLAQVDPKTGLTYNDKLRAIHDLFGHAMEGYQFGPRGEENAWIAHSQMFSPEALPAVTTETKGQNSWVNAGPHLRDTQGNLIQPGQPGYIPPPQRPFAEQKAGLLPDRFHYRNDAPVSFISPNTMNLSLPEAQQRLNSVIQKRFTGASQDLANQLGLRPSVRPALGSWEGGAENSVIHQFPVGTDPDAVRYYNSILGKLGYQNSIGSFFPGEGSDSMYAFWAGGKGTSDVARALLDHGIENSTIEPAEGGHTVYLIGSGDDFRAKVDQVAKALGHTGEIEEYGGTAEFPGNSTSRDAAARDFSSAAEALESKHPEWKSIREGFESRPDINSLRDLIQSTKTPVDPQIGVVHYSNTPGIDRLDPSYYGQNAKHDINGSVVNRPDLRRKESFPNYWNPETYVGDETNPQFRKSAADRFAARNYTYKGSVPEQGIYDLAKDPDGILQLSRQELEARNLKKLGVRLQPSDAEVNAYAIKRLKDLGYSGRRDVNGLIASWDKVPVTDAHIPPALDISQHIPAEDAAFRREKIKTWADVSQHLTPDEQARYDTKEKQDKIVDAVNAMPSPQEWDAAVKAGISGKLWYERSSRAFDALVESQPDMFRKNDKGKFLNFVAALSPVQPVRQNLLMAVNLWDKWNKAGRPVDVVWKDPKSFSGLASKNSSLYRILKGGRNTYGVDLPARMNNAIRALQDQPMSGPKVSAFGPNLGADATKSTNDTWMAIFGNTDPNRISQPHLYDAMSSMVREAGDKNNIPPRQAQAAIWSFIKSLAELSGWGKDRWIPPQEIIKQKLLTPDLINKHAADFADMLANDTEIRDRIQAIGGDLNALDRKLGKYVPERPDQGSTPQSDPRLLNAAKRLEAARENSRIQSHLAAKSDNSKGLFGNANGETEFDPLTFKRERRVNDNLRKSIDEMSPDEMRHLLLHSHTVDLPNSRSFDEAEMKSPAPAVAMSDADGLKAFNDKFGYEAGNALLKAKADALKAAGLDAYHDKGDEFLYRGNSPEELKDKLEKARDILRNKVFDVTMDDGSQVQLKGVDFSYGVGHDLDEAESGQHTHKNEREARGERKRGELAGIAQVQKEDQVNQGPQDLNSLKAEAASRNPDVAFKRDKGGDELDKLKYIDPKSSLGLPGSAALVTSDGKVSLGKWHETLARDLGYKDKDWEEPFMKDGGIRVRANKGEISVKFGKDDSQTLDNVRKSISTVKGNKVTAEFWQNDKMKHSWTGSKNDVLQKLDAFEGNRGGGGGTYGSAVQYYRGDAAFKRENPFYLKSEKVIDDKMKGPMPAADVLRMLKNNGIKEDELKWTGLDDLLGKHIENDPIEGPYTKITPQQIKDHLAQNAVQIQEVTKGQHNYEPLKWEPIANPYGKKAWQSVDSENPYTITKRSDGEYSLQGWHGAGIGIYDSFDEAVQEASNHNERIGDSKMPKYSRYSEPGGQNYRELLLTMPGKPNRYALNELKFNPQETTRDHWVIDAPGQKFAILKSKADSPESAMQYIADNKPRSDNAVPQEFKSNHWSEPNVLAHIRMNDRTGPNGEKLLHLEEVQSDWHQKGRTGGYARSKEEMQAASDTLDAAIKNREKEDRRTLLEATDGKYGHLHDVLHDKEALQKVRDYRANDAAYQKSLADVKEAQDRHNAAQSGVPNAPFKSDWHEMALRRMMQYAAENGYDGVSWTGGDKQAARYDLSKQVDSIDVMPRDNGSRRVMVNLPNNEAIILNVEPNGVVNPKGSTAEDEFHGKHISDVVGKDIGEKIMTADRDSSLKGEDLKVGGSGMRGFYDKIVPQYLNKFGKKFGAQVSTMKGLGGESPEKLKRMENDVEYAKNAVSEAQQKAEALRNENANDNSPQNLQRFIDAVQKMKEFRAAYDILLDEYKEAKTRPTLDPQYIPITPEMRKSLTTEGVPLFKRGDTAPGKTPSLQDLKTEAARRVPVAAVAAVAGRNQQNAQPAK